MFEVYVLHKRGNNKEWIAIRYDNNPDNAARRSEVQRKVYQGKATYMRSVWTDSEEDAIAKVRDLKI